MTDVDEYPTADKIATVIQDILQDYRTLPIERCIYVAEQILELFPRPRGQWIGQSERLWWEDEFANDDS